MTYVLEIMTEDIQKKILSDVKGEEHVYEYILKPPVSKRHPHKWAVDYEKDSYIFLAPHPKIMPEYRDYYYNFYFEKKMYTASINVKGRYEVAFAKPFVESPSNELKTAFLEALSVLEKVEREIQKRRESGNFDYYFDRLVFETTGDK